MALTIKKVILAASIALLSNNVQANVIVDTGPTYGSSLNIFDTGDGNYQKVAGNFILNDSYIITDILASFSHSYDTTKINISVHKDQNNDPGDQLFTKQFTLSFDSPYTSWSGLSNLSLALESGSYWVVFSGIVGEPRGASWSLFGATNPLPTYKLINNLNGYPHPWRALFGNDGPGLQILGTPAATVPEPQSLVMLLAGLGLLTISVRRNHTDKTAQ